MKPNFKDIDIFAGFHPQDGKEWQRSNGITASWKTPEQIQVKPVYTQEDLEGMEHLNYAAGLPPFLRGPYSMMYAFRPWTIRQKSRTHFTVVTWLQDRKDYRSRLTFLLIVAMTQTILV